MKQPDLGAFLPAELSFLTLAPEALILSAVKRSEDGESLVVRFYNPTAHDLEATLTLFQPVQTAQLVNLNEEPQAELTVDPVGGVSLPVAGKQVRTVALRLKRGEAP